ncbi:MAG: type IV toxin-antitoxin system AbiEi family antitoxin domain-containing protein [Candidatus Cryosericum sp.]
MDRSVVQKALATMPYVTKQNLGVLLDVSPATLDYRVRRMQKAGDLIPIRAGLYVPARAWQAAGATPDGSQRLLEYLSGIVRLPSYISLEYVLERAGLIPESPFAITCVTQKTPRAYTTAIGTFIYRQIRRPELSAGYIIVPYRGLEVAIAPPGKALFDTLYLRPFRSVQDMSTYLLETGRFNWDALAPRERRRFIALVRSTNIPKMKRVLTLLQKEKIV